MRREIDPGIWEKERRRKRKERGMTRAEKEGERKRRGEKKGRREKKKGNGKRKIGEGRECLGCVHYQLMWKISRIAVFHFFLYEQIYNDEFAILDEVGPV